MRGEKKSGRVDMIPMELPRKKKSVRGTEKGEGAGK